MKLRTRKFLAGLLSLGLLLQAASPLSALAALLVWNTAGRPEPVNTPAFADVADADTAKAVPVVCGAGPAGGREREHLQAGRLDAQVQDH